MEATAEAEAQALWQCKACTFENQAGAGQCEVCGGGRPDAWTCKSCTLANDKAFEECVACRMPRVTRRRPKKGDVWRPANDLLAAQPPPTSSAPLRRPPMARRQEPALSRGQFVQGACRMIFGQDGEGWRHTWRVDMPCSVIPACPICLEEPSMPRISECGHIFCLACIVRFLQTGRLCPICGVGPLMLDELRPVQVEVVRPPRVGDEWSFQLVRRTGDNIGLPCQHPPSGFTQEGQEGWRFARRVQGNPVTRLELLHRDIHALEKASGDPESGLDRSVAASLVAKLQNQLVEVGAAARAATVLEAKSATGSEVLTVVFYQSKDEQLIFLEPLLTKKLLAMYGSWGKLPEHVNLKPIKAVHDVPVNDDLRRRHRFLSHLAIGGEVIFADGTVEVQDANGSQRDDTFTSSQQRSGARHHNHRGGGRNSRGGRGCYSKQPQSFPPQNIHDAAEVGESESTAPIVSEGVQAAVVAATASEDALQDGWDD